MNSVDVDVYWIYSSMTKWSLKYPAFLRVMGIILLSVSGVLAAARLLTYGCLLTSDYYLTEEYVNTFAHEVQARPSAKVTEDVIHEDSWVDEVHGDPTDGEPTPSLQQCTDNWKAAAADSLKRMWDAFHESGWYVSACRHGFILWVADMIRSGELYVR